jgi:hypothetical protein
VLLDDPGNLLRARAIRGIVVIGDRAGADFGFGGHARSLGALEFFSSYDTWQGRFGKSRRLPHSLRRCHGGRLRLLGGRLGRRCPCIQVIPVQNRVESEEHFRATRLG